MTSDYAPASPSGQQKRLSLIMPLLVILLIGSLLFNVSLARQVQLLKSHISLIRDESQLMIGEQVQSFIAKDSWGNPAVLGYHHTNLPTALYIFTPGCESCARNLSNIKALVDQTAARYRIVGLSLSNENLQDYIAQNSITFPVYTEIPFLVGRSYKLGGTPQTLVISPTGTVLQNWKGTYEGQLGKEVENYFQVKLPGIVEAKVNH